MTIIEIRQFKRETVKATVVGTTDLLTHNIPPHVIESIRRKNEGLPEIQMERTSADQLYEWAIYRHPDPDIEYGFPARALKEAMVRVAKPIKGLAMKDMRSALHVLGGDRLPLRISKPSRYDCHERNPKSKSIIPVTYACFKAGWEIDLTVLFHTIMISRESVINLLHNSGMWSGIGRRRPELGGTNGMFEIKSVKSEAVDDHSKE